MGDAASADVLDDTVEWLDGGLELALVTGRATQPSQVYQALAAVACDLSGRGSTAVLMADPTELSASSRLVRPGPTPGACDQRSAPNPDVRHRHGGPCSAGPTKQPSDLGSRYRT